MDLVIWILGHCMFSFAILMDVLFDMFLLHACLDGRRGEFVGFELYECSGVGWISSQSFIVLFTILLTAWLWQPEAEYLYKLRGD